MSRNSRPDIEIDRGKRFVQLSESFFHDKSRAHIGGALGGYSESAVRKWEAGVGLPNRALIELQRLGVSLTWLLQGKGKMFEEFSGIADGVDLARMRELHGMMREVQMRFDDHYLDALTGVVPEDEFAFFLQAMMKHMAKEEKQLSSGDKQIQAG